MSYEGGRNRRRRQTGRQTGEYGLTCVLGLLIGLAFLAVAAWFAWGVIESMMMNGVIS
jgi:hypothetical protein